MAPLIFYRNNALVMEVYSNDVDLLVGSDLDMSADTAKLTLSDGYIFYYANHIPDSHYSSIKTTKLPKKVNNEEVAAFLKRKKKLLIIKAPLL